MRLCTKDKSGNRCSDLCGKLQKKKMCSVSFNKVAPLVRKQAFFLKCPEHPPFPIESRHFLHFSFPRNSLVVSLTGMPTLKELISTLSQVGWKLPRSLSADFILVSSEKNINQPTKQKTSQQQQHEQEKKKKNPVNLLNLHTILSDRFPFTVKWVCLCHWIVAEIAFSVLE